MYPNRCLLSMFWYLSEGVWDLKRNQLATRWEKKSARERERERERKRAQETSGPVLETPSELGSEAILQRLACLALLQLGLACTKASGLGRDETWLLTD